MSCKYCNNIKFGDEGKKFKTIPDERDGILELTGCIFRGDVWNNTDRYYLFMFPSKHDGLIFGRCKIDYCPFCGRRLDSKDELTLIREERKRHPRKPPTKEELEKMEKCRKEVAKIFEEREKEEEARLMRKVAEVLKEVK